jgi:tight adherence protein C
MLVAIAAVSFAAVTLAVWGVLRPRESVVARRIRPSAYQEMTRERRLEGGLLKRVLAPVSRRVGRLLARLLPQNVVRGIDHMLVMANEPMSLSAYLTLWAATILVGVLALVYIALARSGTSPLQLIGIGMAILSLAVLGPFAILRRRVRMRQRSISRALPDALDLLVTSVEAGLGVDAAFAMVVEKTRGPLSETFALYLKEVGLGRPRRDALAHVANRTGVPDLVRIALAVVQTEEMGTTLGDALRTQAEDLRLTRRQRAQEAAQKAPVLMTIPLALCFLPAMVAVVIVPSILNLIRFVGDLGNK